MVWRVVYIVLLGLAGLKIIPFAPFGLYAGARSRGRGVLVISLVFLLLFIVRDVFDFLSTPPYFATERPADDSLGDPIPQELSGTSFLIYQLATYGLTFGIGWHIRRWKLPATLTITSLATLLPLLVITWMQSLPPWYYPTYKIVQIVLNLMIFGGHELLSWLFDTPAPAVTVVGDGVPLKDRAPPVGCRGAFLGAILVHPAILLVAGLYGFVFGAATPIIMSAAGGYGPFHHGFAGMNSAMGTVVIMHLMSSGITFIIASILGAFGGLGIAIALRNRRDGRRS